MNKSLKNRNINICSFIHQSNPQNQKNEKKRKEISAHKPKNRTIWYFPIISFFLFSLSIPSRACLYPANALSCTTSTSAGRWSGRRSKRVRSRIFVLRRLTDSEDGESETAVERGFFRWPWWWWWWFFLKLWRRDEVPCCRFWWWRSERGCWICCCLGFWGWGFIVSNSELISESSEWY